MTDLRVTKRVAYQQREAAQRAYLAAWTRLRTAREHNRPATEISELRATMDAAMHTWEAAEKLITELEHGTH